MKTQTFPVKGMHCASCSHLIKSKLSKLAGIDSCEVNFATEKAKVNYDPQKVDVETMNDEIKKYGYELMAPPMEPMDHSIHDMNQMQGMDHSAHLGLNQTKEQKLRELEEEKQKTEFVMPIAVVIFISMMWDIAARTLSFIPNFPIPMGLFNTLSFILATVVLFWIGKPFIDGVIKFIRYRVANMDTLIGIGTLAAYIYSSIILLFPPIRELLKAPEYLYFDVVIVVIGFVKLGKYLEARSKLRTGEAIEKLLNLQAKTAIVERDGKEIELSLDQVQIGDVLIVKPGTKVPVDGVIIEGSSSLDESMISGEPIPVDKKIGDTVIGATINKQGHFKFKATKVGSDTVLAQIIKMVEEAQGSQAPIQGLADKISAIFVPVVLAIAIITFFVWIIIGSSFVGVSTAVSFGFICFVSILVIACPCALGLATPTAIIVGVGKGAEHGILIKNAESLERLREINTVVMDKTGTITEGKPVVSNTKMLAEFSIFTFTSFSVNNFKFEKDLADNEDKLLTIAASVEKLSEHPIARAIVEFAQEKKIPLLKVQDFRAHEGVGVEGKINGKKVIIRKPTGKEHDENIHQLQSEGKTVVIVEVDGSIAGIIAISDTLKGHAVEAIQSLHRQGVSVVMLTGDNQKAAQYIAKQAGIDTVIAEVLPQDKANKIKELQNEGKKVAMAGDGINDAPALTQADVGIAMATGTDVAIESADVVLLHGDIKKVAQAITLSKATVRTIKQNLFWAFIYNLIGIPLAAGILYPFTGLLLNPIFAGLAMAGSSVSVVANSLRLKGLKLKQK